MKPGVPGWDAEERTKKKEDRVAYKNGEVAAFGAECGSRRVHGRVCGRPPGPKKTSYGIRPEIKSANCAQGSCCCENRLRPMGFEKALLDKSRSALEEATGTLPRKSAITPQWSVLVISGCRLSAMASHSPMSLDASQVRVPVTTAPDLGPQRNFVDQKRSLTTPAIASEPYTADAPVPLRCRRDQSLETE